MDNLSGRIRFADNISGLSAEPNHSLTRAGDNLFYRLAGTSQNVLTSGTRQCRKSIDQSVTSSTSYVDCSDMSLLLGVPISNAQYYFEMNIILTNGSGFSKFIFSVPSGASGNWSMRRASDAYVSGHTNVSIANEIAFTSGTSTRTAFVIHGTISMGTTLGSLQLRFAQQTSNAAATTVLAGSAGFIVRTN